MTELVPRTVTEIGEVGLPTGRQPGPDGSGDRGGALAGGDTIDWGRWLEGEGSRTGPEASRSLEAFRESTAYVLLGAPGAGKTTAFKTEAELAGGHYVTARDFLTLGARPEWRKTDATLFIDGLDEKRAGSMDGRTPLDDIRARIDAIGRPRFRLSCREADWSANDRIHLDQVAKDGKVKVLRLEPLSDQDIRKLLARHPGVEDAGEFLEEARQRGIGHLLTNPQTLKMLADAVSGEAWPETRTETFVLACEKLVQEPNPEHRLANRDAPAAASLLAVGGRLCAVLLLTGHAGYDMVGQGEDPRYLDLASTPDDERTHLRLALHTRLFESPEEGRRVPTHRQIAESLAARYLAKWIDDGLPVRRVLALMTGEDGGIVSELRGLAAWLAAHCLEARGALIERDPEGVAMYSDAGVFSRDEKRRLLEKLRPPDPFLNASLFTSLATADMAPVIRDVLNDQNRDCDHRKLVLFLLRVLANARPLPNLADSLLELAANEDHPQDSRQWAAICLANGTLEEPEQFGSFVRCLLSGLREGRLRDEGKNLLGYLLRSLYPEFIDPDEVFDYLDEDHERNRHIRDPLGPYDIFWRHELATEARPEDEVIVLDKLEAVFDRSEEWRRTGTPPATPLAHAARLFVQKALVDRAKEHAPRRTLRWLKLAGVDDWDSSPDSNKIRDWLEARPELYKDLLRETVAQCLRRENIQTAKQRVERLLHGAGTPPDYGRWCLKEIERVEGNDNLARFWFEEAWNALLRGEGASGVTLEHLEAIATRNASLVQVFDRLRTVDLDGPSARRERKDRQRTLVHRRNKEQVSADRQRFFGQHEEALRENRCPVDPLNTIAKAYLGSYLNIRGKDGRERLRNLLGDGTLVEAAMDGLRGAVRREDLPTPQDVLALWADNQRHLLAFPVVAGLDLLPEASISALDDSIARVAVALLVASRPPSPGPGWVRPLFESRPDAAAEEIVRFATAALRRGGRQVPLPFVPEMLDHEWLSEVARIACPRLLRAFPVRAPRRQFNVLKRLLWWGADHLEASAMAPIIAAKLAARSMTSGQRAYWLAANLAVSGEPDPAPVEDLAERHESAMAGFFAFYERSFRQKRLLERLASPLVGRLARLLGVDRRPLSDGLPRLSEIRKSDLVRTLIEALGTRTDDEAVSALSEIARDPAMAAWHATVQRVQHNQRAIRRDARYCHPNEKEVRRTLERIQPANVADLAALAFEHISTIAKNIRDGSTNDWRQYWERGSEPWRPAPENDCRDALLSDLKARLHPLGVEAVPEGRYADENRSDIRVSFGGFNVPVEIKKSSSRDLWRGIQGQLITKYARDPGSSGYGIYLVFWFGNHPDPCQTPESGTCPKNAADLEERLRGTLSREEARLISICVIDVAKP